MFDKVPILKKIEAITIDAKTLISGEKIICVITKDQGKKNLIVRGSNKITSKQAGKIDILSRFYGILVERKSGLDYLIETREIENYLPRYFQDEVVRNLLFDLLKMIKEYSKDEEISGEIFESLQTFLSLSSDPKLELQLGFLWIMIRLTETSGYFLFRTFFKPLLQKDEIYFDSENAKFFTRERGVFKNTKLTKSSIKLIYLLSMLNSDDLHKVKVKFEDLELALFVARSIILKFIRF